MIPFLDLKTYNAQFQNGIEQAMEQMLVSGQYVLGPGVAAFESSFANYCGSRFCVGTANGLDALILILKGYIELGRLSVGDEVIVPANTYIASILAVIHTGLKPVLVEPDPITFNLCPDQTETSIGDKTKAIMAVHLYGRLADMEALSALAKRHNLLLIEDAAQAHGAMNQKGNRAGSLSDAAGFSFYPTKNLGALGDAGAVTTDDEALNKLVRTLRNYGAPSKYINDYAGINSRLDEFQALVLSIKLPNLNRDNGIRQKLAQTYNEKINNERIRLPDLGRAGEHVFHQYVLRLDSRDHFISYMTEHGIGTLIHYPVPPHKQKALSAYASMNLPITEAIHNEVVSVPLNPVLTNEQQQYIIETINAY